MREGGLVQCEIWSVYVCKCACVTKGTSLLMFTFLGSLVKSIVFNCHPQMFIRTLLSIYSDTTVWKVMRGALCLTSQQMSRRASEMLNWGINGVWLEGMTHVCQSTNQHRFWGVVAIARRLTVTIPQKIVKRGKSVRVESSTIVV